ncbi:hypothetical protein V495_00990 [Pseudogymnoascus sp. VKM F-4514 (FW-929)]|nr:hypothetical protein V495_00990 [Pseudogymnoascus sp. VKM F-4514 (FW-929)]
MPELSILNADPPLLAGPALLHDLLHIRRAADLVSWDDTSAPALDYLGPEGSDARCSYTYGELRRCVASLAATLLHDLVSWDNVSAPALDYLGPEGSDARCSYTYGELHRCVASLAATLHETLISSGRGNQDGPQLIIPLLVPQSPALYIAQLAALQVGAAFCPINLDAPKERIKFIAGDVKAELIISTRDNADAVTWEGGPTPILIDINFPIPSSLADLPPFPAATTTSSLAYVMYTSGSTGLPKGVGVSHRAATQSLLAHEVLIPSFTRFLQFAAPSFDVSVFEIFFPLYKGSTLIACHRERLLNDLPGTINAMNVDGCELTPTVVGSLLLRRANVPGLKLLLTIGEMLTRPVVDEFGYSDDKPGMLYGMYGPTEAAIHCTAYTNMAAGSKVGNIGRPFSTVSCFIAAIPDPAVPSSAETLDILPIGEVGELVLGGTQLADGYLNREKENKAAFVSYNGSPAYRTGDKGRILSDGTIEVMGRISAGQVKLRGQRVELGEIEEVVYKHRGIELAFASVLEGMLIVFARAGRGEDVVVEELMETCEKWLPRYMVPSEVVVMTEFPYLPSGKIDKKKLEAEYLRSRAEEDEETGEVGETEKTVARALQQLLRVRVNPTKRLAGYGLDSLVAIRLASHLRSARLRISPVEILEAETLREIARVCEERLSQSSGADAVVPEVFDLSPLETTVKSVLAEMDVKDPFEEVMPCTPLQDAMLLETIVDPVAYNNFLELRINSPADPEDPGRVVNALRALAGHNPLLRTGFVECESEWSAFSQVVWPALSQEQIIFEEQEEKEERREEGRESEGLDMLRPLRMRVCQYEDHAVVRADIHHALYDGWSLELLVADLSTILSSSAFSTSFSSSTSSSNDTSALAELKPRPPFRTLVEHTLRLASSSLESQKQYWKDHLAHFSPRSLPSFHATSEAPKGLDIVAYTTSLSTAALDKAAAAVGASSQALVQTAYALVLSKYLGTADICFGSVFSGRSAAEVEGIEEIAGPCIATLPVRVEARGKVGEVVQEMQRVMRRHMENEALGLREIQAVLEGEGGVFDTLVIWQQSLAETAEGEGKKKVEVVRARDYLEFVLTLEVTPQYGKEMGLRLDANYQTAIFSREMVKVLLRQVEGVVAGMIGGKMEGNVESCFENVEVGELAVWEGEVSSLSERAGKSDDSPIEGSVANRRANAIARLVTGRDEEVSIQQPLYGKVRGWMGRVGKGVKILVIAPSAYSEEEGDVVILPLGAEGELCIAGPAAEADLAGAKLITHPVYGKLLRTGDLVRLLPGGEVVYRGRIGEEVLVRGQRVEVGEVDGVVLSHADVRGCATMLVGGGELVTFFTLSEEEGGEFKILDANKEVQEGIFAKLEDARLPSFAVPTSIVSVSCLPTTTSGDLDTSAFRAAYAALTPTQLSQFANPSASSSSRYTWTPLESLILSAVTAVSKSPQAVVKPNTPFAALGIDSIAAIGLVRRLREGGVGVDVGGVLRFGSVKRLASFIETEKEKEKGEIEGGGEKGLQTPEEITFDPKMVDEVRAAVKERGWEVERVLPCTPLQEGMLAASELSSSSTPPSSDTESGEEGAYVNRVLLDLKVPVERVEEAWKEMVKRHEILRTCFVRAGHVGYAFCQVVLSGYTHDSQTVDVEDAEGVEDVMRRGVNWTVEGEGGYKPPYSLTYVRVANAKGGEEEVKLVLAMHHALYDGFAMGVLYEEMEAYLLGNELQEPVSFAPFLRYMTASRTEEADEHWRGLLGSFSPVPFVSEEVQEVKRQNHVLKIASSMKLEQIEEKLAHNSTSLLSVCQTAWAALLSHRAQNTDICLGSVVSGRTVPVEGLNRLVAPCFNTIPFRLRNLHRLSYLEACRVVQEQNVQAVPWQMTGLRRVQALTGVEGGGLFDSLVLVQTEEREMDAQVWTVEEDRGGMDFPVVVEIVPRPAAEDGGVLEVTVHTHDLPLDKEQVAKVAEAFDTFLTQALTQPREQIVPADLKSSWASKTLARRDAKSRGAYSTTAADDGAAWTDLEMQVRSVIAAFTTVPEQEIGRGTSIYRLGLDSINAVQVATKLRAGGFRVVASEVLMHRSVRELAAWIGGKSAATTTTASGGDEGGFDFKGFKNTYRGRIVKDLGVDDKEVEGVYPCTPVQSGMLAQTMHSGGVEYVNSYTLQLGADVELERLRDAWAVVVRECPMLRVGFVGTERGFAVVVYNAGKVEVPWVDGGEEVKEGMSATELAKRPWRLEVLRSEGGVRVKFTAHHALYDAQSLHLIFSDVQAAYTHGTTDPLLERRKSILRPPLPGPDAPARDKHKERGYDESSESGTGDGGNEV